MPQEAKAGPQKRGLYHRSSDEDIFFYLGKFAFLTAEELAHLSNRNPVSLRKRLRQLTAANIIGRDSSPKQRTEFFEEIICDHCQKPTKIPVADGKIRPNPFFHYLLMRGGARAAELMESPIAFKSKAQSRLDHDRVITLIHLSLDRAFAGRITNWLQQKDDVRETVELDREKITFYPDAWTEIDRRSIYIEYANSEPSSTNGVNDIVEKVRRYNPIMRNDKDAKVLFIFRERAMVENFVNRLAADFPYLWIYATDVESIKHNPTGKIFWTPKDFEQKSHALIE